jgi:hypothetical protein
LRDQGQPPGQQWLGLDGGIASAPLISIAPNERFRDLRYAADYDPRLHRDMAIRAEHLRGRLVIAYDPTHAEDAPHARTILALGGGITPWPAPK